MATINAIICSTVDSHGLSTCTSGRDFGHCSSSAVYPPNEMGMFDWSVDGGEEYCEYESDGDY